MIDFLSIVPFDLFISPGNYNDSIRLTRIGRMYKLVKMIRLLRILKIVRDRAKLLKYLTDFLKIGLGFERLFFFFIIFSIMVHTFTCFQVMLS